jgi:hypothetical protein
MQPAVIPAWVVRTRAMKFFAEPLDREDDASGCYRLPSATSVRDLPPVGDLPASDDGDDYGIAW